MTLETNKILGGFRCNTIIHKCIANRFYGRSGLVGAVLILVSLYGLAGYYKNLKSSEMLYTES